MVSGQGFAAKVARRRFGGKACFAPYNHSVDCTLKRVKSSLISQPIHKCVDLGAITESRLLWDCRADQSHCVPEAFNHFGGMGDGQGSRRGRFDEFASKSLALCK